MPQQYRARSPCPRLESRTLLRASEMPVAFPTWQCGLGLLAEAPVNIGTDIQMVGVS
jgi:hypothetical protein